MDTTERLEQLPTEIWDCERCGCENSMQLRRSSFNESFMADDIGLKCSECYYYATHGVAFDSPEQFETELAARDGRVRDFAREDGDVTKERLESLGYVAKADSL